MEKDLNTSVLLDFYIALMTDRQADFLRMYYDDDMSLAEISNVAKCTRQAAQDAISRGTAKLRSYEKALGLQRKYIAMQDAIGLIESGDADKAAARLRKALEE